jgi:hypothetical protein
LQAHTNHKEPVIQVNQGKTQGTTVSGALVTANPFTGIKDHSLILGIEPKLNASLDLQMELQ